MSTFSSGNIIISISIFNIVYAGLALNSIAQLFILPTCFYVAETWFIMEERSFAIGVGFYSNLLGFATGAIITALLVKGPSDIKTEMIIITVINWLTFLGAITLVRNKPKIRI